jgi:hypothetical protein
MEVVSMPDEVEPVELRARCQAALREKIKAAAEKQIRSVSAEIAYRLQKSFEHDEKVQAGRSP